MAICKDLEDIERTLLLTPQCFTKMSPAPSPDFSHFSLFTAAEYPAPDTRLPPPRIQTSRSAPAVLYWPN